MEINDIHTGMFVQVDLTKDDRVPKIYRKPLKVKVVEIIKDDLVRILVGDQKYMIMIKHLSPLNVGQKAIINAKKRLKR